MKWTIASSRMLGENDMLRVSRGEDSRGHMYVAFSFSFRFCNTAGLREGGRVSLGIDDNGTIGVMPAENGFKLIRGGGVALSTRVSIGRRPEWQILPKGSRVFGQEQMRREDGAYLFGENDDSY